MANKKKVTEEIKQETKQEVKVEKSKKEVAKYVVAKEFTDLTIGGLREVGSEIVVEDKARLETLLRLKLIKKKG